ncbi:TetR/AcrR family transcriptional regulator [Rhizorhabdus sp. FW153]|uniref:TetR/AcrR family transcriptional regulator n=1 Tax=Rhizorhabdus sp. FW153 TaxID=3400216 RepID=UPI003CF83DCD
MFEDRLRDDVGLASTLRAPVQGRSRESYGRMMVAAEQLLGSRGNGDFTLAEVSRAGRVSIGSIYNRFENKEALLHAVQLRILERVNREMSERLAGQFGRNDGLDQLVARLVEVIAETLRAHAGPMAALMRIATDDPQVSVTGKRFYSETVRTYSCVLLSHREDIARIDPERAVDSSFRILYAAIARYLGFGSATNAAWEGDWTILKDDLAAMIAAFLGTP